uniref:Uncharacterized protein n=1 Tax=viral metagenome TaxID=1070528 RepID=A0A6C0AF14_9ZZZZ
MVYLELIKKIIFENLLFIDIIFFKKIFIICKFMLKIVLKFYIHEQKDMAQLLRL